MPPPPGSSPPKKRGLEAVARALFAPLLLGQAPGWKVVSWDAEQGLAITLQRGDRASGAILVELEDRNDGRDCFARTARFNVCARRLFDANTPITVEERAFLDRFVQVVRAAEGRLPLAPPTPAPTGPERTVIREILVERALIPEGAGSYYFNPYAGCMIGCPFCYVAERADLSRRLEGLPSAAWGRWLDVKVNAAEVMRREVETLPPGLVRMSPILTDPYQPVEKRYRITRQCLEVLLGAGFTPVILTRAARVTDDLDLLARFPRAAVGFSIPTDDDAVRRAFEPGADPVEARFEALAACHAAGLYTFGVIQPMLPMNAVRLVEKMAPLVRAVRIDRMHFVEKSEPIYRAAAADYALGDEFFAATERTLTEGFTARGVAIDRHDNLEVLLGALMRRP